jgi:Undecaprenyl-phosphate glucose phosphotransferase
LKFGAALSRGAVFLFFAAGLLAVVTSRVQVPVFLARLHRNAAYLRRSVIVLGATGDEALAHYADELKLGGCSEPHIVTFHAHCSNAQWPDARHTLLQRVLEITRLAGPGEIFLATGGLSPERIDSIVRGLSLVPRSVLILPDDFTAALLRQRLSAFGEHVAVEVQREPLSALGRAGKRAVDIVLSSLALLFLAPLLVAIAIAVKCDSPGPALFRQTRNGRGGRPFQILKFRTMIVQDNGPVVPQARKNDHRVTRLGRWLRRTSLDELPQLFNVLSGEMSLVGPRPHAAAHDELYGKLIENYEIRQHVKPGITGWAQVNGLRGETRTIDLMYRRIEYDLWYAMNCSPALDFRILGRTVLEVLKQRNAY